MKFWATIEGPSPASCSTISSVCVMAPTWLLMLNGSACPEGFAIATRYLTEPAPPTRLTTTLSPSPAEKGVPLLKMPSSSARAWAAIGYGFGSSVSAAVMPASRCATGSAAIPDEVSTTRVPLPAVVL